PFTALFRSCVGMAAWSAAMARPVRRSAGGTEAGMPRTLAKSSSGGDVAFAAGPAVVPGLGRAGVAEDAADEVGEAVGAVGGEHLRDAGLANEAVADGEDFLGGAPAVDLGEHGGDALGGGGGGVGAAVQPAVLDARHGPERGEAARGVGG